MDSKMRLSQMAQGFQLSAVLLTANRLGVFDAIGAEGRTAPEAAATTGLNARALETILLALAAHRIVERDDERFRVAPDYAPFLLPSGADPQTHILAHNHHLLQRWARMEVVLRTGRPLPRDSEQRPPEELRDFICGMADISRASSAEVAEKVDLSPYRRMLDLGGGPGTSSIVFARRFPALRCVVFDLEGPLEIAREEIARVGLGDRIETRVGDYYEDEFGEGFDLVYVSNIIHSMAPDDVEMIARKAHRALSDGGAILIKDFFLDETRTSPSFAAMFSVNMLIGTEGGKSYTEAETREILARCGFGKFEMTRVANASGVLKGCKNAA